MTISRTACFVAVAMTAAFAAHRQARADTYGLPPATEPEAEWRADETALVGSGVVVIRSGDEWSAFWKKHDPEGSAPEVDFEARMVVGVFSLGPHPHAIYRVELDDASDPREFVVRVARDEAAVVATGRGTNERLKGSRLHLIAMARSALPVRFVLDDMVDGRVFRWNGGVAETELGRVPGIAREDTTDRAAYREDAETLARRSLSAEDVASARKTLWPRCFGERYPQLWSLVRVRRDGDHWSIVYDSFRFQVDVKTGEVTRLTGK